MLIPTRGRARSAALAGTLVLAAACSRTQPPPPPPEFSQARAWSFLTAQISFGPRYPGGRGHERQLEWLREELKFRADTLVEQTFMGRGERGEVKLTSLVARFRPELSERVLLVATRDTRRRADGSPEPLDRKYPTPGANVNASGVAVLMELATLLREQPPQVGVDLLFVDGDDFRADTTYPGTRAFLAAMPGYRPKYALYLQGVGGRGARFPQDAGSAAGAAAATRALWATARGLGLDSVFVAQSAPALPAGARALQAAGIPTVVVAGRAEGTEATAHWHALDDQVDFVSRETLGAVGRTVTAHVYGETAPAGEP